MNQITDYITADKRKALEAELEELKGAKRKEILASLKSAKALGDLSENAEYHQAREDQGHLEARITKIEEILKSSQIIKKNGGGVVGMGSKVIVQKVGDHEERVYSIVGSEEADTIKGRVSNKSPIGEALLGKKKGDDVSFTTPSGVANYKIKSVS